MFNKEVFVTDCTYDQKIVGKLGYIAGTSEDDCGSVEPYGIFVFDEGCVFALEENEFELTGKIYNQEDILTQDYLKVSSYGEIIEP